MARLTAPDGVAKQRSARLNPQRRAILKAQKLASLREPCKGAPIRSCLSKFDHAGHIRGPKWGVGAGDYDGFKPAQAIPGTRRA